MKLLVAALFALLPSAAFAQVSFSTAGSPIDRYNRAWNLTPAGAGAWGTETFFAPIDDGHLINLKRTVVVGVYATAQLDPSRPGGIVSITVGEYRQHLIDTPAGIVPDGVSVAFPVRNWVADKYAWDSGTSTPAVQLGFWADPYFPAVLAVAH